VQRFLAAHHQSGTGFMARCYRLIATFGQMPSNYGQKTPTP
jgi:hypothetical protein